jgi:hypothetical protein
VRALLVAVLVLTACAGEVGEPLPLPVTQVPHDPNVTAIAPVLQLLPVQPSLDELRTKLTPAQIESYLRRLAPMLVGRSLRAAEIEQVQQQGGAALPVLIDAWTKEEGFVLMAREWVSTKLKASGKRGDLNLELPGNLAAHLARNRLPHSELLTANYCIDDAGNKAPCDSGAPYAAGVLTTRAFLSNNASRFNLKRARTVLRTFGCKDYPMPSAEQPPLAREVLIPLFQQDKVEGTASGTFGNGFACYTCHSQFGAHAQPFVKFNQDGRWIAGATGRQVEGGEQGRSVDGLFTSHMIDPLASANEGSQIFGKQVDNLAGVAESYVTSPGFWTCSVGGLLGFAFGLAESTVFTLPPDVLNDVVAAAKAKEPRPSLALLAVEAFSHPAVVRSFDAPESP